MTYYIYAFGKESWDGYDTQEFKTPEEVSDWLNEQISLGLYPRFSYEIIKGEIVEIHEIDVVKQVTITQ
jgi:hypothetical protein